MTLKQKVILTIHASDYSDLLDEDFEGTDEERVELDGNIKAVDEACVALFEGISDTEIRMVEGIDGDILENIIKMRWEV